MVRTRGARCRKSPRLFLTVTNEGAECHKRQREADRSRSLIWVDLTIWSDASNHLTDATKTEWFSC
ncbi:hypothetical protein JMJ77_0005548 [Colletotrichum scovillei]|uniref:Uncharacterized protein n=1 Tax=Colletotrichum scovillei TaxID=1209932 RepID=A0A9P7RJJ6_9PEZI|nr:hypothetical protein JMJ77_0005548 [Colletotrichum scovillei]KAG7076769.1 hypothetical protein JMJ76_0014029 [Colletotrichum scovillei]KAG7083904.1 hypothetical protein JMJ78_0009345 [Colletotrichum scovillei]